MRAKLVVTGITEHEFDSKKHSEHVTMRGVSASQYPEDGSDENNTYAKWSPTAVFAVNITNPNLWGKFHEGQQFYVDFTEVEAK